MLELKGRAGGGVTYVIGSNLNFFNYKDLILIIAII